jgi:hypothetical protein
MHQAGDGPRVGRERQVNLQSIMKVRDCAMATAAEQFSHHPISSYLQLLYPAINILELNVALAADLLF